MRTVTLLLFVSVTVAAAEWARFRGPNGSGVSDSKNLPATLEGNLLWKTAMPTGYSSPAMNASSIYLTAFADSKRYTIRVDRRTGKELWRVESPSLQKVRYGGPNSPVSPSPVVDGVNVYVFFDNFGVASYDADGKERWRASLGPFNAPYGMGASPIIAGDKLILLADQDGGSFLIALDKNSGRQIWRQSRSEFTHGFSTPLVYTPSKGPAELIVSGSYQVAGYSLDTGDKLWWVTGMAWQAKSAPVIQGDKLFVHSWMASLSELGHKEVTTPWKEALAAQDKDGDGRISKEESPDESLVKHWFLYDMDQDGHLGERDWTYMLARSSARNGLYAIRLGGRGDVTKSHVLWRYDKSLPNIPSPLLYNGVLWVLKEGGILTALNPEDGKVLKQGRVEGAIDSYFASPIAADGKIFVATHKGKVAVLKASTDWETLSVMDLGEEIWATPAISDGQIVVRTQNGLYCFGRKS